MHQLSCKTMLSHKKFLFVVLACLVRTGGAKSIHFCVITSYREQPYVQETSDALLAQILAVFPRRVTMSINVAAGALPEAKIVSPFAKLLENREMATGEDCTTNASIDPLPSCRVRQQGLDVANALESCYNKTVNEDLTNWILLLEDDFMPCENALEGLLKILDTLDPTNNKFARFTQGSGGVAFPKANIPLYTRNVREHILEQPYDHVLLNAWSNNQDFVFPVHLFHHIGDVSSIAYRNSPEYRTEFAGIRDNTCGSPITV